MRIDPICKSQCAPRIQYKGQQALMYRLVAALYVRRPLQHRGEARPKGRSLVGRKLRPYDRSRCAEHVAFYLTVT